MVSPCGDAQLKFQKAQKIVSLALPRETMEDFMEEVSAPGVKDE